VADLDMKYAMMCAGQLTTIGHPLMEIALKATAADLVSWCKGGIFGGRPWTPADQASDLVQEARLTFGNWEKAGGTTALRRLFYSKFDPTKLGAERQVFDSKKWEEQYGPPDPAVPSRIGKMLKATKAENAATWKAVLWQAIRDAFYYTEGPGISEIRAYADPVERSVSRDFWAAAAVQYEQTRPAEVAAFRQELAQYGWAELRAFDWMKGKEKGAA
jgi:hypothetical protein